MQVSAKLKSWLELRWRAIRRGLPFKAFLESYFTLTSEFSSPPFQMSSHPASGWQEIIHATPRKPENFMSLCFPFMKTVLFVKSQRSQTRTVLKEKGFWRCFSHNFETLWSNHYVTKNGLVIKTRMWNSSVKIWHRNLKKVLIFPNMRLRRRKREGLSLIWNKWEWV